MGSEWRACDWEWDEEEMRGTPAKAANDNSPEETGDVPRREKDDSLLVSHSGAFVLLSGVYSGENIDTKSLPPLPFSQPENERVEPQPHATTKPHAQAQGGPGDHGGKLASTVAFQPPDGAGAATQAVRPLLPRITLFVTLSGNKHLVAQGKMGERGDREAFYDCLHSLHQAMGLKAMCEQSENEHAEPATARSAAQSQRNTELQMGTSDDAGQTASTSASHHPRRPRACRVPGCNKVRSSAALFFFFFWGGARRAIETALVHGRQVEVGGKWNKYGICTTHANADSFIDSSGVLSRFCQKCKALHPVSKFKEGQKSCAISLRRQSHRRNTRVPPSESEPSRKRPCTETKQEHSRPAAPATSEAWGSTVLFPSWLSNIPSEALNPPEESTFTPWSFSPKGASLPTSLAGATAPTGLPGSEREQQHSHPFDQVFDRVVMDACFKLTGSSPENLSPDLRKAFMAWFHIVPDCLISHIKPGCLELRLTALLLPSSSPLCPTQPPQLLVQSCTSFSAWFPPTSSLTAPRLHRPFPSVLAPRARCLLRASGSQLSDCDVFISAHGQTVECKRLNGRFDDGDALVVVHAPQAKPRAGVCFVSARRESTGEESERLPIVTLPSPGLRREASLLLAFLTPEQARAAAIVIYALANCRAERGASLFQSIDPFLRSLSLWRLRRQLCGDGPPAVCPQRRFCTSSSLTVQACSPAAPVACPE